MAEDKVRREVKLGSTKDSEILRINCEIAFAYGDKGQWKIRAVGEIGKDDPTEILTGIANTLSETIKNLETDMNDATQKRTLDMVKKQVSINIGIENIDEFETWVRQLSEEIMKLEYFLANKPTIKVKTATAKEIT